ncbi:MAG: O-antigen polysaccharide polymerase Wzy [Pseudomonadota bacterium]
MTLENSVLFGYCVFSVSVLILTVGSVRANRPALTVFLGFCFFYLCLRGVMLLTGAYGIFGILHGGRTFDATMIAKLLAICVIGVTAVLVGYGRTSAAEFGRDSFKIMPQASRHIAFLSVWLVCIVAMSLVGINASLNWSFSFVVLGAIYMLFFKPVYYPRIVPFVLGLVVLVFALGQTVERRDWAIAAAAIALIAIMSQSQKLIRTTFLSTIMLAFIAFSAIMLRTGEDHSVSDTLSRISTNSLLPIVEIELDFPLVYDDLVILVDEVPRRTEHTYGRHFFKPFYSWIPRSVWPAKPDTISRYYSENLNPGFYSGGGSEPATFIGELYWNFSFFGVFFAAALGFLIKRIDTYWANGRDLLWKVNALVLATMLFYLLRGPIDTFWLAFAFYFGAWFVVSCVYQVLEGSQVSNSLAQTKSNAIN